MRLITGNITIEHFIVLAVVIFSIGIAGIIVSKKNVINILMSIELMLLAANINFMAFSSAHGNLTGQLASIIVLSIAAAEAAIGLAIVVAFYRKSQSISIDSLRNLKG